VEGKHLNNQHFVHFIKGKVYLDERWMC